MILNNEQENNVNEEKEVKVKNDGVTIGSIICYYRKEKNLTQDQLAEMLNISPQAISKWENNQACPDIQTLPILADIFGVTIDTLFGRVNSFSKHDNDSDNCCDTSSTEEGANYCNTLPWGNDGVLRAVLFKGTRLMRNGVSEARDFTFTYEGEALDVKSSFSINCGDISGDAKAGSSMSCKNVEGDLNAGSQCTCGSVSGDVRAGSSINCTDISGDVVAGSHIKCGNIGGDAKAGTSIECGDIGGDVRCGSKIIRK